MAYEFLRLKGREPFTGMYFMDEPALPVTEPGELFRFRDAPRQDSVDNVITNLKGRTATRTIETTAPVAFRPDGYVVIQDELWRINTVTKTPRVTMAAFVRRPDVVQVLTLQQVVNPIGLRT